MKKLIFVLTLLLLMSPVWANVNVFCTPDDNEVSVYYAMDVADSNRPVAFGLDIQADSGATVAAPSYVNPNFWVYPGSIDVNTEGDPPTIDGNGVPYGDPCDHADTKPGPGYNGMTIEVGALFSPPEVNSVNAPPSSGLLLKFAVSADCNVTIAENVIRGGVVLVGGDAVDPNFGTCSVTQECLKSTDPGYTYWKDDFGSPECWCYRKQCNGDGNGASGFGRPVTITDLDILRDAYGLLKADVIGRTVGGVPSICSDFNHTQGFGRPVTISDLDILREYYGDLEATVPQCPDTHINFWTN